MRRNPEAKGTEVELLNVPRYGQGTFDSLCAYYTGAMMLATNQVAYRRRTPAWNVDLETHLAECR